MMSVEGTSYSVTLWVPYWAGMICIYVKAMTSEIWREIPTGHLGRSSVIVDQSVVDKLSAHISV
jgi:hypothetical protein